MSRIAAFGRHWVFGEEEQASNQLLGVRERNQKPINMAHQSGVYILYEREKPVYVGKTESDALIDRLRAHHKGKKWGRWDRFSWFGLRSVIEETGELRDLEEDQLTGSIADVGESLLIEVLDTKLNRQSGNCMGEMYVQVRQYVEVVREADARRPTPFRLLFAFVETVKRLLSRST